MSLSASALRPSRFKPGLLVANIGSKNSLLADSPHIGALNSTVSYDSSRLSSQTTNRAPLSQPPLTFREFIEPAWSVVEPATPFIGGYHVDAIAEHLQAIANGDLHNLIVNIPPRHSKSSLVCVLWPAWTWTQRPHLQWLFASYREALAIRDSVKTRRLITSSWYQERWGGLYRLTGDQNEKRRYENDKNGHRISIGVGTGTGDGGDVLVLDDAISADQAESDAYRESANDWIDATFSTRGNDPRTVARVIVMQRLHEADPTGHILDRMRDGGEPYDHLVLPAEYEPRVQVCMADLLHDPRTVEGEPLSPERFGPTELLRLKATMGGELMVAGQLQQRPAPAGGAVFKREWWADGQNRYDPTDQAYARTALFRYLSVDTAFKDGRQNDYTAIVVGDLMPDYRLVIREIRLERVQFYDLIDFIQTAAVTWNYDGKLEKILVEEKGSGISAIQELQRAASPHWIAGLIYPFMPGGSKEYRARKMTTYPAEGLVLLPHDGPSVPWLLPFAGPDPHGNLFRFPNVTHDDDVDAFVQLIDYLSATLSVSPMRPVIAAIHAAQSEAA